MITKLRLVSILGILTVCFLMILVFSPKDDQKQYIVLNSNDLVVYENDVKANRNNQNRARPQLRAKRAVLNKKRAASSETGNLVALDSSNENKLVPQSSEDIRQLPAGENSEKIPVNVVSTEFVNPFVEPVLEPIPKVEASLKPERQPTVFSTNLPNKLPDVTQTANSADPGIQNEGGSIEVSIPSFQPYQTYSVLDDFSNDYEIEEIPQNTGYQVKLRAAAFFPAQKLFRSIYGNAGATYEVEATKMLPKSFQGWINANWFFRNGHVEGSKNKSDIKIANLSLGVNWVYEWNPSLTGYLGLGANVTRVFISNRSFCGQQNETKYGIGGVVKSGIQYRILRDFFLEVFVDYLYQPIKFEQQRNVGGFKTGTGLGINF